MNQGWMERTKFRSCGNSCSRNVQYGAHAWQGFPSRWTSLKFSRLLRLAKEGKAAAGMKFMVRSSFSRDSQPCKFSTVTMLFMARFRYRRSCKYFPAWVPDLVWWRFGLLRSNIWLISKRIEGPLYWQICRSKLHQILFEVTCMGQIFFEMKYMSVLALPWHILGTNTTQLRFCHKYWNKLWGRSHSMLWHSALGTSYHIMRVDVSIL